MNQQVRISAHLFFFFVNAICFIEFIFDNPLLVKAAYRKITFLTNYNQFWVVFTYFLLLKEDILMLLQRKHDYSLSTKRYVKFLFFQSGIIALVFWPIYLINPNFIFSPKSQQIIPEHIVYMFHGGNFLALAFDCLKLISIKVRARNEAFSYSLCYGILTASNYILFGRFVYPFQKFIPAPINAILTIAFLYGINLSYKYFSQILDKKLGYEEFD